MLKRISNVALTVVLLAIVLPSLATAEFSWTKGEVKKVDLEQGKVTVKHDEIVNLDMPAMTMVFPMSDTEMLKKLKVGQTAQFEFVEDKGRIVIRQIRE